MIHDVNIDSPNFKELGFKVGLSFIGYKHLFSTPIRDSGFARPKTSIFLETKLFKGENMSR